LQNEIDRNDKLLKLNNREILSTSYLYYVTVGLKEFSVFVDLATISAGESTEKMAMVKSLHAGVNAYSPLIFDMSQNDDYRKVIQKCKIVWKILEESPMIYESLVSILKRR
jgi:hypothetical protein